MREGLRQPSNLNPHDESALAHIGHNIEAWEAMKDSSVPLSVRKEKMIHALEMQMEALERTEAELPPEHEMLMRDFDDVRALQENEEAVSHLCTLKINYYSEVRESFLSQI
jgi:hypothetical protein